MFDPRLYDRPLATVGRFGPFPRQRISRRPGRAVRLLGPGAVVAVAYVDPGNFATNVSAGAALGQRLVWVVVAASVAAMLVQYLAAKAGAVTGRSLPELCRDAYPRPVTIGLWLCAEVVAAATELVEVVGGAVALALLLGLPLPVGGLVVGLTGTVLLLLGPGRRQRFTTVVAVLLAAVVACFLYAATRLGIAPGTVASGMRPSPLGSEGLLLAAGIVGATVMPHAVHVHSALAAKPTLEPVPRVLRGHRRDIAGALSVATVTNVAILLVGAAALHGPVADGLHAAYAALRGSGGGVGLVFAVALLVAGIASSCVGTYAGDVVMRGFLRRRVPMLARRLVTLGPAVALLASGLDPTWLLVACSVVLACGLPTVLVPLLHLTSSRSVMGDWANRTPLAVAAGLVCAVVCVLDAAVVVLSVG